MALTLRCARGDHLKFSKMLEICARFTNVDELIKEARAMTSVATTTEQQHMIPDAGVDALQIDVLLWAMEEVESDDPGQIAWWAKHRSLVRAPTADAEGPVAPAIINLHDDDDEMWMATPMQKRCRWWMAMTMQKRWRWWSPRLRRAAGPCRWSLTTMCVKATTAQHASRLAVVESIED